MEIPIYLALTPAEFLTCAQLPSKAAWMACHFSSSGSGLTNLPQQLPAGSLLILDDSTPYQEHDFDLILSQLSDAVSTLKPEAVLLDLQRPDVEDVQSLVHAIVAQLPCPVAVSSCYAGDLDCPVFLPPGPLHLPLAEYLNPYKGRKIWLDAAPVCAQMIITPESSRCITQPSKAFEANCHYDKSLHCNYRAKIEEDQIIFSLSRSCDNILTWLSEAEALGVSCAVGIYQELKDVL